MSKTKCLSISAELFPRIRSMCVFLGNDSKGNFYYYRFEAFMRHLKCIHVVEGIPVAQAQWKLFELPPHVVSELAALQLEGSV